MQVKVTSNLFGKTDLTGVYKIAAPQTIEQFLNNINIKWEHEALIVVNEQIVEQDYSLMEGDHIYMLTPIYGG
jgi:sulfur carrier protein ThiS